MFFNVVVDKEETLEKCVYVETHGCSTNLADGEVIIGCLSKAGYNVVSRIENANVLIYNTCAVKTPTENRMTSLLKKTPKDKTKLGP